jgi:deoxyadenosine/deoxycytidine kinase
MTHVFVSGNIGAGKSTVMNAFKRSSVASDWTFIGEPADEWSEQGLLGAMYDGTLSAGEFQLMALISRVTSIQLATGTRFIVAERSPWEDAHVFASTTLSGIAKTNYNYAHAKLMQVLDPSIIRLVHIVLEVDDAVALGRIAVRNRGGENTITSEYLQSLNEAYKTFDPPGEVFRVNANGSEGVTLAAISQVCEKIRLRI